MNNPKQETMEDRFDKTLTKVHISYNSGHSNRLHEIRELKGINYYVIQDIKDFINSELNRQREHIAREVGNLNGLWNKPEYMWNSELLVKRDEVLKIIKGE